MTLLIRHGATQGNLEGRYIGCRTDEPLCSKGIQALMTRHMPPVRRVFVSPMRRCLQTAEILFPGVPATAVFDLRECDFGAFEGMNYAELNGRADYQAWIDSGGELPFPGGESRAQFALRSVRAFEECARGFADGESAFVVHGGTVMAVMERYARPRGTYFDFQVGCGEGYALEDGGAYARL
ncbi:MAG: histidine phosphatase family protein [Clostridia bacterium]|nr:histidine phosphatase family protein [Clostridia bacterium]